MVPDKKNISIDGKGKPREVKAERPEDTRAAHDQAEKDIENDADLSIHSPNDDLDESESAKLGEDKTGLV